MENYYKILNVSQSASQRDIRQSYYNLSKKYHPDKNPNNLEEAKKNFQKLNQAHSVLSDEAQRAEYDRKINVTKCDDQPKPGNDENIYKTQEKKQRKEEKQKSSDRYGIFHFLFGEFDIGYAFRFFGGKKEEKKNLNDNEDEENEDLFSYFFRTDEKDDKHQSVPKRSVKRKTKDKEEEGKPKKEANDFRPRRKPEKKNKKSETEEKQDVSVEGDCSETPYRFDDCNELENEDDLREVYLKHSRKYQ